MRASLIAFKIFSQREQWLDLYQWNQLVVRWAWGRKMSLCCILLHILPGLQISQSFMVNILCRLSLCSVGLWASWVKHDSINDCDLWESSLIQIHTVSILLSHTFFSSYHKFMACFFPPDQLGVHTDLISLLSKPNVSWKRVTGLKSPSQFSILKWF